MPVCFDRGRRRAPLCLRQSDVSSCTELVHPISARLELNPAIQEGVEGFSPLPPPNLLFLVRIEEAVSQSKDEAERSEVLAEDAGSLDVLHGDGVGCYGR